jgi:hypothetical protein
MAEKQGPAFLAAIRNNNQRPIGVNRDVRSPGDKSQENSSLLRFAKFADHAEDCFAKAIAKTFDVCGPLFDPIVPAVSFGFLLPRY